MSSTDLMVEVEESFSQRSYASEAGFVWREEKRMSDLRLSMSMVLKEIVLTVHRVDNKNKNKLLQPCV